jgi:hypothetical protein
MNAVSYELLMKKLEELSICRFTEVGETAYLAMSPDEKASKEWLVVPDEVDEP